MPRGENKGRREAKKPKQAKPKPAPATKLSGGSSKPFPALAGNKK